MSEFSLDLSEEQRDLRDWVHGFAADVVRPAAAEWDEKETTPWPIIQEAAKIGLYSFEFLANLNGDPTGLSMPIAHEELFWGDAGIGMALMGTGLAVAAIFNNGTPEQLFEWVPQCFGDAADPKVAAFCSTEPEAGSDVVGDADAGPLRRGHRRVGPQRPEGLRDQRRHRQRARRHRERRPVAGLARPGGVHRPARHPGTGRHQEAEEAWTARLAHRRRLPRRRTRTRLVPGRRQGEAGRAAGPRPGRRAVHPARPRCGRSRRPGRWSALRRSASPGRRTSTALEYAKNRVQFGKPIIENQADRVRARGHEDGDRRGPAAGLARLLDGSQQPAVRGRRGLDEQAQGRPGRGHARPSRRCRSSAVPVTCGNIRSNGGTATRRSTPSSKAPPRSSGS